MALTSWSGDRVRKADVTVSKNYLALTEARKRWRRDRPQFEA